MHVGMRVCLLVSVICGCDWSGGGTQGPFAVPDTQFAVCVSGLQVHKLRLRNMLCANLVGLQTMCKPTIHVFANQNMFWFAQSRVCIFVCKEWTRISHPRKRKNVVLLEVDAVSPHAEFVPLVSSSQYIRVPNISSKIMRLEHFSPTHCSCRMIVHE